MMLRLSIGFILCLTLVIGCGPSTKEIMNSWKGAHVSRLIRSWGPPQEITSDGLGGRIYIWRSDVYIPITKGTTKNAWHCYLQSVFKSVSHKE